MEYSFNEKSTIESNLGTMDFLFIFYYQTKFIFKNVLGQLYFRSLHKSLRYFISLEQKS